jgi:threonylcarbamoyladenosine tRNA methylthiotransferase MtaB
VPENVRVKRSKMMRDYRLNAAFFMVPVGKHENSSLKAKIKRLHGFTENYVKVKHRGIQISNNSLHEINLITIDTDGCRNL